MTEEDIESYMEQFNVDRATAIKQILEALDIYYKEEDIKMDELYQDIIRSSH